MSTSSATSNTSPTRRRVLGWGGAGVIGGLAGYWGWQTTASKTVIGASTDSTPSPAEKSSESLPDSPSSVTPARADGLRREDFVAHLKSAFQLDSGAHCTLVEVGAAQKLVSPIAEFTSFSLLFTAPASSSADSRIYQLTHAEMGKLNLFISPIGRSNDCVYLEAVCCQRV